MGNTIGNTHYTQQRKRTFSRETRCQPAVHTHQCTELIHIIIAAYIFVCVDGKDVSICLLLLLFISYFLE